MSDQSDTTSLDGSTAPHGCTARGRTIKVAALQIMNPAGH